MSKTNPLPIKEKSIDINEHVPIIGSLNKVIEKKAKILNRLIGKSSSLTNDENEEG